ncbi:MAG: hypothetical protein ACP5OV_06435 [Acidimicrobiales bacterium]
MSAPARTAVAPAAWVATGALTCAVIGGIVMASFAPRRPPLAPPLIVGLVGLAALAGAYGMLARTPGFSWSSYRRVFRWALLAYVIAAALIEFAFLRDHTRGAPLAVVSLLLVDFALSVPMTIATTVASLAD